ncbi:hypothetical protein ABZ424_27615 [Streptomyces sp. NPDC005790]|uniref:hypothetical protein n=1 Tax=Streptomyces sp. NPDC005790 TaxID=3154777 RepID=UPI0033F2ACF2
MTEPTAETVVALLRAGLANDQEGQAVILASCNPLELLGALSGFTIAMGHNVFHGADNFDAFLADWQAAQLNDPMP